MRHATTNNRRQRNRGANNGGGGGGARRGPGHNRMQVFDSNGPDVRIRGTAHQVTEKYATLAKDAASAGDRVLAESYLQYAEHYQRIISSWDEGADDRPVHQHREHQPRNEERTEEQEEDDLSLPGSILVPSSQAKANGVSVERTAELAAE
ncbi:MAG: DUF4167 domain-containing protein [Alphaproteobacteria bacterium]|nr:DUF4167 domain-containing protein [Alphaproteobacteria bacterium]